MLNIIIFTKYFFFIIFIYSVPQYISKEIILSKYIIPGTLQKIKYSNHDANKYPNPRTTMVLLWIVYTVFYKILVVWVFIKFKRAH